VDRLVALVEEREAHPDGPLRLRARGREGEDLALEAERVAGAHGGDPAQLVDAEPEDRMRPERTRFYEEPHRDRRRVPAADGKPLEDGAFGCGVVEVVGLRVEGPREGECLLTGDGKRPGGAAMPYGEVVEPDVVVHAPLDRMRASGYLDLSV